MTTPLPTPSPVASRAGELLLGRQWAMLPNRLPALRTIAERVMADPKALTSWADAPVPSTYLATSADGIATIRVTGILQRQWDFWCWIFGGTAYEVVARDLATLQRDPAVRAIVLEFDSPGGEVAGCHELAELIRELDQEKPVVAHAAGLCCSAAYWLASACREVIADPTAVVGSIGVISEFIDARGWKEYEGIEFIELVSSQSPRKAMDPATAEGRADWQALLDALAAVFIAAVARNRGVDEETVLAEFGQGSVFDGSGAIAAGLADALGTAVRIRAALNAELASATDFSALALSEVLMATSSKTARSEATRRRAPAATADPAARTRAEGAADEEAEKKKPDEDGTEGAVDEMREEDEEEEEKKPDASAPVDAAALRAEGATAERARILGIHGLGAKVKGAAAHAVILAAMQDPAATKESVALQLVELAPGEAAAGFLAARAGDEDGLEAPSNAEGPAPEGEQGLVQSITSLFHAHSNKGTHKGQMPSRTAAAGRN